VVDGGDVSMTRSTSTRAQLSVEELKYILEIVELVCKMLLALKPILSRGIKNHESITP